MGVALIYVASAVSKSIECFFWGVRGIVGIDSGFELGLRPSICPDAEELAWYFSQFCKCSSRKAEATL